MKKIINAFTAIWAFFFITKKIKNQFEEFIKEAFRAGGTGGVLQELFESLKKVVNQITNQKTEPLEKEAEQNKTTKEKAQNQLEDYQNNEPKHLAANESKYHSDNKSKRNGLVIAYESLGRRADKLNERYMEVSEALRELPFQVKQNKFKWGMLFLIGFISYIGCETPILWSSLETWFYTTPVVAIAAALTISFLGAVCGHFTGKYIHKEPKGPMVIWFLLGMGINAVSIGLRYAEGSSWEQLILTSLLIITVFMINTLISAQIYKGIQTQKLYAESEALEKAIDENAKEMGEIELQIQTLDEDAVPFAARKLQEDIENVKTTIDTCTKREGEIALDIEKIKVHYKNEEEVTRARMTDAYNKGQLRSNRGRTLKFNTAKVVAIGFILATSMGLGACSNAKNKEVIVNEIALGFDISESQHKKLNNGIVNPKRLYHVIWQELELDSIQFEPKGALVHLSVLGASSYGKVITVELKPQPGHWLYNNRMERELELKAFQSELKTAIQEISSIKANQQNTHIHRPSLNLLHQFSETSTHKKLFLVSDFISDNSLLDLDNRTYRRDPSKIIEKDFTKLSKILLRDISFPTEKLKNLEVVLVQNTTITNDNLSTYCTRFFRRLYQEQGITVIERSNL